MKNKKICFLITNLDYGGAEIQVKQLAIELKRKGYSISIITLFTPRAFIDELNDLNIQIYSLKISKRNPIRWLSSFAHLIRTLKQLKPDILHTHLAPANIMGRLTRIFVKYNKLISTVHSIKEGGVFRDFLYRLTNPLVDITTYVSKQAYDIAIKSKKADKKKSIVIYNFIDQKKFNYRYLENKIQNDSFEWITVGRLNKIKNQPLLLESFSKLPNNNKLKIIGKGSDLDHLKDLALQLKINHRVEFLGVKNNISDLLSSADAFVLSSKHEAYGIVLAEAMSTGLPVVTTSSEGPKEILAFDPRAGIIVENDNPIQLTKGMQKLLDLNEEERVKMGKIASSVISNNFSLNIILKKWLDVYDIEAQENL